MGGDTAARIAAQAQCGDVWQEADGVLLLCIEPGVQWQDFRGDRIRWDAPRIAHPLRRLLDPRGNLAPGVVAQAKAEERERIARAIGALLSSEDAHAVLYGVTGTHPESYGGVTKDEALECAGSLLGAFRDLARAAREDATHE